VSRLVKKNLLSGYCHITHRCQERKYFFKFSKDRDNYVERLRNTVKRYGISVLNYVITSNHIHLLIYFKSATELSGSMHYLEGSNAKDYNLRKKREGVFWSGRYHATLIEKGKHLSRCMFYIDMNMIRTGAVTHPLEWKHCGYHELSGRRKRYRIIKDTEIINIFGCSDNINDFRKWYNAVLDDEISRGFHKRESFWSESVAVGSRGWIESLSLKSGNRRLKVSCSDKYSVKDENNPYILTGSTRNSREFWKKYS
jgi:putative transposase